MITLERAAYAMFKFHLPGFMEIGHRKLTLVGFLSQSSVVMSTLPGFPPQSSGWIHTMRGMSITSAPSTCFYVSTQLIGSYVGSACR